MVKLVNTKQKNPSKDWRVVEYFVPISEAVSSGKDFLIRGTAINETTTRNGITYNAQELQSAAPSFRNKPIMVDHSGSVKDIVGRTTENVQFSEMNRSIEFEGRIMDPKIKEMINDGRITDVSIGARVEDLIEDKKAGTVTAVGMEGLEISLVAIPGDPGANLANALHESFRLKVEEDGDTQLNNEEEVKMEEAEKKEVEQTVEQPAEEQKEEVVAEEKASVTNVNVDMSAVTESLKTMSEQIAALTKKVAEQEETPAPSEKSEEDEIPTAVEDETQGEVGSDDEDESEITEESFVVESAESGRGMSLYRDYSKASGKFNRLCR